MIHLIHTIDEADQVLSKGNILIYPTETLWGMGADITQVQAIQKIFQMKQRSHNQPISLLIRDIAMAQKYALLKEPILNHITAFWPGPVTFVLPALSTVATGSTCRHTLCGFEMLISPLFTTADAKKNTPHH